MTDIQTNLIVGGPGSPMVNIHAVRSHTENNDEGTLRFHVDCAACGSHVQHTGEGGYTDIQDARRARLNHQLDHVNALIEETVGEPLEYFQPEDGDNSEKERAVISKTTYLFTVLHRTDTPPDDLQDAVFQANEGHSVGLEINSSTVEVPADQVARELVALGNDGTFFDFDLERAAFERDEEPVPIEHAYERINDVTAFLEHWQKFHSPNGFFPHYEEPARAELLTMRVNVHAMAHAVPEGQE